MSRNTAVLNDRYNSRSSPICFRISGRAAHGRIAPLLPSHWIDKSPYAAEEPTTSHNHDDCKSSIDFLWENAPRNETKPYRDHVKVYSHLPNGTCVLDDKWVLSRFFSARDENDPGELATLKSHCFRGHKGFRDFCDVVGLNEHDTSDFPQDETLQDLMNENQKPIRGNNSPQSTNMWVIKDAQSNGAGGIWIVGPENVSRFKDDTTTPLLEEHRYVAQEYAYPPVLYHGRKCHVRVYGLITADGRAYCHKRAFLHVANDAFHVKPTKDEAVFDDCIHITNCCANSHDDGKFSGEICADLEAFTSHSSDESSDTAVISLGYFFPSIRASLAALAKRAYPFLRGGQANGGFEYLGMDFILSYDENQNPIAYLLEVNAPPSQDTATGLKHAEDLHNEVLKDLLSLVVLPKLSDEEPVAGGWRLAYQPKDESDSRTGEANDLIIPSKASILNKIRLAIFERKSSKSETKENNHASASDSEISSTPCGKSNVTPQPCDSGSITPCMVSSHARSRFPYFSCDSVAAAAARFQSGAPVAKSGTAHPIFFENAGGSQVPYTVIHAVSSSLAHRNRSIIGHETKEKARTALLQLVGGTPEQYCMLLGSNASSLFDVLARQYTSLGALTRDDEVIICSENHTANSKPWLVAASRVGAKIKWWTCTPPKASIDSSVPDDDGDIVVSSDLQQLLTPKTRVVALSHSSNILGELRNLSDICKQVRNATRGRAHVVADGVSATPHVFANVSEIGVDWYGLSCHKMFGPHLGGLCAKQSALQELLGTQEVKEMGTIYKHFEIGTISYEACAGVVGLATYFQDLACCTFKQNSEAVPNSDGQPPFQCTASQRDRYEWKNGRINDPLPLKSLPSRPSLTRVQVEEAYRRIRLVEMPLTELLLTRLRRCRRVRIVETSCSDYVLRLPVIGFVHRSISSSEIVKFCSGHGIACRNGLFLCTGQFQKDFDLASTTDAGEDGANNAEGIVRISCAHYNTTDEVEFMMNKLESMPNWW